MILLGLAVDPLMLVQRLPPNTWTVNAIDPDKKNALFIGTKAFKLARTAVAPNRIMIFDIKDRAETLEGLVYIPEIDPVKSWERIQKESKAIKKTSILPPRNVIAELIEKNKDKSFIHLFITNIYRIKFQPTRNAIRDVYLDLLNDVISRAEFDMQMASRYPKRGETKDAVDYLMSLTKTNQFQILHQALKDVRKEGADAVDVIAARYKIESFDLNYLIANREQKKTDG